MYGIILAIAKDLVVCNYGESYWKKIVSKAGCPESFEHNQVYADQILTSIFVAMTEVLSIELPDAIEAVGYWFITHILIQKYAYGDLLKVLGSTFPECLGNINSLHSHLLKVAHFPEIKSPSFYTSHVTENSCKLHYTAGVKTRCGFAPLVIGLVKGIGELVLGLSTICTIDSSAPTDGHTAVLDVSWAQSKRRTSSGETSENSDSLRLETSDTLEITKFGLAGPDFARIFPFHICFDKKLRIVQIGKSIHKISALEKGDLITDNFILKSPSFITFSFKSIYRVRTREQFELIYSVQTHSPSDEKSSASGDLPMFSTSEPTATNIPLGNTPAQDLILIGEMVWLTKQKIMCFICTPKIDSVEQAESLGLCLSDFALHDQSRNSWLYKSAYDQKKMNEQTKELGATRKGHRARFKKQDRKSGILHRISKKSKGQLKQSKHESSPETVNQDLIKGNVEDRFNLLQRLKKNISEHPKYPIPSPSPQPPALFSPKSSPTQNSPMCPLNFTSSSTENCTKKKIEEKKIDEKKVEENVKAEEVSVVKTEYVRPTSRLKIGFIELLLSDIWAGNHLTFNLLEIYFAKNNNSGKTSFELLDAFMRFYSFYGKDLIFFKTAIHNEVIKCKERETLFRSESIPTKIFGSYTKLSGCLKFLKSCANSLIEIIIKNIGNINESNLDTNDEKNVFSVKLICETWLDTIHKISSDFQTSTNPKHKQGFEKLKMIAKALYDEILKEYEDMKYRVVANMFFFRCIIPFALSYHKQNARIQKMVLIVVKLINALINEVELGEKEKIYECVMTVNNRKKAKNWLKGLVNGKLVKGVVDNVDGDVETIQHHMLIYMDQLWSRSSKDSVLSETLQRFMKLSLCCISESI